MTRTKPTILAIANQKGGVGKTTTAINLGAALAASELRVLVVDSDPQGNATRGLGASADTPNLYHVLTGSAAPRDAIRPTGFPYLDLLAADGDLVGVEVEFVDLDGWQTRLRDRLASLGTAVSSTDSVGRRPIGSAADGNGPDRTGPDKSGPDKNGPVGTGLAGTGLAGTGLAGTGLAGTELARTELVGPDGASGNTYDVVLIDCPPSLGHLTVSALVAADGLVVPLQCEYFALEGISALLKTVRRVSGAWNPSLKLIGIVLTMYDERTNLSKDVADEVREHFAEQLFQTVVPRNVRLAEAPSHGRPVLDYDVKSRGAQAYLAVARELMERI